jgi:hypothetical protein
VDSVLAFVICGFLCMPWRNYRVTGFLRQIRVARHRR